MYIQRLNDIMLCAVIVFCGLYRAMTVFFLNADIYGFYILTPLRSSIFLPSDESFCSSHREFDSYFPCRWLFSIHSDNELYAQWYHTPLYIINIFHYN